MNIMGSRIFISEQEKSEILKMYGLIHEDARTPLQKLMECKFTSDGKYVVFEGKSYSCETGEEVTLNEEWTLSDILHTGADVLSAGMDFVIPGSGAIIDTLNAVSYIIEAQFKTGEEKDSLYLMAAITFGFVVLPGPLQTISIPLKRAIKTGVGMTSKVVVQGLKIIGGALDTMLLKLPSKINQALKSPMAKNIMGKYSGKISGFFNAFTKRIKQILSSLKGETTKQTVKQTTKRGAKVALTETSRKGLFAFFKRGVPKIKNGSSFLRKMGFVVGKEYRYIGPSGKAMTATIKEISGEQVKIAFKFAKGGTTTTVPISTFVKNAVGAPWTRRGYSVAVPLFIKRFADYLTPQGEIDYTKVEQLPELDPNVTSQESLEFLQEEVASYEGETKMYTKNTTVTNFQNALIALGYSLPKYGADGKFGPETQTVLKKFQEDNGLTSSIGKMDRTTARKLSELLKSKNIANSQELQNALNSI